MEKLPNITSTDYWFKVVEFLQQNWAVIEENDVGCHVYFFNDLAGIFDKLDFSSRFEAENGLRRNGFDRYDEDEEAQKFIGKPEPHFELSTHPNGPIYSSGRFWH